jgi:pyridine nucleotide-disulfide oxidoreductase family protein
MKQTLVLVGGGHAHLHVLHDLIRNPIPNTQVIVISISRYQYYSGMFASYLEGVDSLEAIRVDLLALCEKAACDWLEDEVVEIDAEAQTVQSAKGQTIHYDCISFNIGSTSNSFHVPGVAQYAQWIKPNDKLPQLTETIKNQQHIMIVGGGASGVELSASIASSRAKKGWTNPQITLVHSGRLMSNHPQTVASRLSAILENKGIALVSGEQVTEVREHEVVLGTGKRIEYDGLIWLTGPAAPEIFRRSRLPVDQYGYLNVNDQLQTEPYPMIFGAGDCVSMQSAPWVHKSGVYAVRQAPILSKNLRRYLNGQPLLDYIPQKHYLAILSLGNHAALLIYHRWAIHATWCWTLKRWIDTRFIKKYQMPPETPNKGEM